MDNSKTGIMGRWRGDCIRRRPQPPHTPPPRTLRQPRALVCGRSIEIVPVRRQNRRPMRTTSWYSGFANSAAHFCGRPRTFALAVAVIGIWVITGPIFRFSDTWQLVINTGTTVITFLIVFLRQMRTTPPTRRPALRSNAAPAWRCRFAGAECSRCWPR